MKCSTKLEHNSDIVRWIDLVAYGLIEKLGKGLRLKLCCFSMASVMLVSY